MNLDFIYKMKTVWSRILVEMGWQTRTNVGQGPNVSEEGETTEICSFFLKWKINQPKINFITLGSVIVALIRFLCLQSQHSNTIPHDMVDILMKFNIVVIWEDYNEVS